MNLEDEANKLSADAKNDVGKVEAWISAHPDYCLLIVASLVAFAAWLAF